MPMYKIVFIDIDGTLQDGEENIHTETKNVLAKLEQMGIYVVLCTGRSLGYTLKKANECNIGSFIITSNGSEIYDIKKQKYVIENNMDFKALLALNKIAQGSDLQILLNGDNPNVENIVVDDSSNFNDLIANKKIFQCIMLGNDFNRIKDAESLINKIPKIEIKNRSKCLIDSRFPIPDVLYYDIANKEVSKGQGIKNLCEVLNISFDNAIAIGDSFNDISMFEAVGLSVAMGNAPEEVKKKADVITDDVDNNGVVNILIKIFNL